MAIVTTDNVHYKNIAKEMRKKTGKTDLLSPAQMADEVSAVYNEGLDRGRDFFRNIDDFYEFFASGHRANLIKELRYDDTSKSSNFCGMFRLNKALTEVPYFDTSNGTDFSNMFRSCTKLANMPNFDTSKATVLNSMFFECAAIKKVTSLNTSNCTDLSYLFHHCQALNSIPDLDTSNCTNFDYMFAYCYSLKNIPLIDTSKGKRFYQTFSNCGCETIPAIDTSSGTVFTSMFFMSKAVTIPRLNVTNSTGSLEYLFEDAKVLENVTFEGVIQKKIGFSYSPKISKATITNVINTLSGQTSGLAAIFKLESVNREFETSEGAADGSSSSEWAALIATKPNWTISLV